jgi:rubrerythrin
MAWHVARATAFKGVEHMQQTAIPRSETGDFVEFWSMGTAAKGEFHCSECGYGVTVCRELPRCPMCGGGAWEQSEWSPESRAVVGEQPL